MVTKDQRYWLNNNAIIGMSRVIPFFICFNCLAFICCAQDTITMNDVQVIKAKSEITVERYLNSLLNTISYTGAESIDVKRLIAQSVEDNDKRIFLNDQIAIADDISSPDYSSSSTSPDVPVIQYLNAFNTYYGKSDTNSVYFSDVRTSSVKRGKQNIYINVYFTSLFKNSCLSNPSTHYKPAKRVAEIYIKRSVNNKWLLYISRIGFFNPADTVNDILDNIVITDTKQANLNGHNDESMDPANKFSQYIGQARLEEEKRNYQAAINLYLKAIDLAPEKKDIYDARIKELNTYVRILADLEEKYRAGYYQAAVKGYSELLKKPEKNSDYSNSDYYLGRAKCFDKMGQLTKSYNEQIENYNKALKDYAKSYEYDNNNLEAIRLRAELYRRMNRNVEALTEYRIYQAKDPSDLSVYQIMAKLHMLTGNPDQAIKDINAVLSLGNPDPVFNSKLNIEKGLMYVQKNDYSGAEDYFTRAIALDSNNAFSYYHRGMARINLNRAQSAANDLVLARQKRRGSESMMKMDSSAQFILEHGSDARSIVNYDPALENYLKFITFQPNETPSSFNYEMGNIYMNIGKYDSAYSYLVRCVQNNSSDGHILYSMASCIYLQGNIEASLEWFERSFQTNALKKNFVDHDTLLGSLQDDKRFRDLKKKYL
jgi:tetratricopeptide (TPR) repeat protein